MTTSGNSENHSQDIYRETVNALIAAAGERDRTAQGHSERVRQYATAIAKRLNGLSAADLKNIGYAASLHDIGKVAISSKILNKLGQLTEEEVQVMRQHSLIAARILDKVSGLRGAVPLIRHHHERYDGNGYPDGLAGENIPIGARIIAVAEAYDILTSDVPWRNALPKEVGIREIERCSGTQFDPKVVNALQAVLSETNILVSREM
ncbi:MAG: HD-GYP domain-containing protein [Armatimonadetes bacterium]|nr:HD-GYP domain-containing protein [Armatimonadota bacterium]